MSADGGAAGVGAAGEAAGEVFAIPAASATGAMAARVFRPAAPTGRLAVVAHGRNGAHGQPQMLPAIRACLGAGDTVLAPDLCHSAANASPGKASGFTMGGHLADLRAAVGRAVAERARLGWTAPGMVLVGHSMGAYAAMRLAAEGVGAPVEGVVAVSPVVSGAALLAARARMGPEAVAMLEAEVPGALAEYAAHDVVPFAAALSMPVALIVGSDDTVTPPEDACGLARVLPRLAMCRVLPRQHHCPEGPGYEAALGEALERIAEG